MKSLKALVAKPPVSVTSLIEAALSKPVLDRCRKVVHASDLTNQNRKFCAREVILTRLFDLPPKHSTTGPTLQITFDEGRDKQWRVNNRYLRDHMVGYWHCRKCGHQSDWGKVPKGGMGACIRGHHSWEYKEPHFRHPSGFEGSLDGVVDLGLSKPRLIEVKILRADEFKVLKAPLAEHRIRTRLYLKLVAESHSLKAKMISSEKAHVLYFMRGFGAKNDKGIITPIKEYVVDRNDAEVEEYVLNAQRVKDHAETGIFPPPVCVSLFDNRAMSCPVAKQCFSGKYPVGAP